MGGFLWESNWRGLVWMPVNYLLIGPLQKLHHYYGDDFTWRSDRERPVPLTPTKSPPNWEGDLRLFLAVRTASVPCWDRIPSLPRRPFRGLPVVS